MKKLDIDMIKNFVKELGLQQFKNGFNESPITETDYFRNLQKKDNICKCFYLSCIAFTDYYDIEFGLGAAFNYNTEIFRIKTDNLNAGLSILKIYLFMSKGFLNIDPRRIDE